MTLAQLSILVEADREVEGGAPPPSEGTTADWLALASMPVN